ncbi:MAG: glycosyltransferase family 2 protein [Pseudomonadales bacterium]|nr:glycosyltransferase family 2 protein [Pseudomonadales bacterium]
MKSASFIAPCYNEELVIEEYYRRVTAVAEKTPQYEFEIVIVNDGSTDRSREILDQLAEKDKRVKVIHLAANQGHQTALFAGIEHASSDINIVLDLDLQDPPELFEEFVSKFDEGYQVIHAQRTKRPNETFFKLMSAKIFYKLLKFISNIELIENCGDFRAFTKEVRETICLFKEKHKFLRGLFVLVGYRQTVIQYDRDKRYSGETKYTLFKMLNLAADAVLSFSQFPIRLILIMSFIMWGASLIYLTKALISHFVFSQTIPGWTSIIFLQVFFTGLILFFMATIGTYIGRVFEQGQQRPAYWIDYKKNLDE